MTITRKDADQIIKAGHDYADAWREVSELPTGERVRSDKMQHMTKLMQTFIEMVEHHVSETPSPLPMDTARPLTPAEKKLVQLIARYPANEVIARIGVALLEMK